MGKTSLVWQLFDHITDSSGSQFVVCKLCESQYKYFGNTTNLRVHLNTKHPIQWELLQNGTLDESNLQILDEDSRPKRKKQTKSYRDSKVDALALSDSETRDNEDTNATIQLVRDMDNGSDEEWLEESYQDYEPRSKKVFKIKREPKSPQRRLSVKPTPKIRTEFKKDPLTFTESPKKSDEYTAFGEYIATKLRKLRDPKTRGNVQQIISTIFWQADYGVYDSVESVRRILIASVEQPEPQQTEQIQLVNDDKSIYVKVDHTQEIPPEVESVTVEENEEHNI